MNYVITFSGPGGCGKDTIVQTLLKDPSLNLKRIIAHTSRAPRADEVHESHYYFVTKEQFEEEIAQNLMLEYEIMAANGQYYGTSKTQLLKNLETHNMTGDKMVQGALKLKKFFGNHAIAIFVDADDAELQNRLLQKNRAIEHDQIQRRLEQAQKEREFKDQFDFCVMNHDGHLEQVVDQVKRYIKQRITESID